MPLCDNAVSKVVIGNFDTVRTRALGVRQPRVDQRTAATQPIDSTGRERTSEANKGEADLMNDGNEPATRNHLNREASGEEAAE